LRDAHVGHRRLAAAGRMPRAEAPLGEGGGRPLGSAKKKTCVVSMAGAAFELVADNKAVCRTPSYRCGEMMQGPRLANGIASGPPSRRGFHVITAWHTTQFPPRGPMRGALRLSHDIMWHLTPPPITSPYRMHMGTPLNRIVSGGALVCCWDMPSHSSEWRCTAKPRCWQ